MKFSHISDTHLGLVQYGIEEREQDIYDSFNQAIDISIKDKVNFVILDRKSTRLNSSHSQQSRMPSSA